MSDVQMAKSLGLFSLALGTLEVVAGRRVARYLRLPSPGLVRAFGVREIAAGLGVLSYPDNPGPIWARVGGDIMDLAVLAGALGPHNRKRHRVAWVMLAVAGATALDLACAAALSSRNARALRTARRTRVRKVASA